MKYNATQPSTDPSEAMSAYSGIRAGWSMESLINSKSLMTGNVSTEESRKEIRKSPGAPSPLANASTFCFHALKLGGKSIPPFGQRQLAGRECFSEAEESRAGSAIAQKRRGRNDS